MLLLMLLQVLLRCLRCLLLLEPPERQTVGQEVLSDLQDAARGAE